MLPRLTEEAPLVLSLHATKPPFPVDSEYADIFITSPFWSVLLFKLTNIYLVVPKLPSLLKPLTPTFLAPNVTVPPSALYGVLSAFSVVLIV